MTEPIRSRLDPLHQVTATVVRWRGLTAARAPDELVAEEPLEIRARVTDAAGRPGAPATIAVVIDRKSVV